MVVQVTLSDGEAAIIRGAATRAHVTIEEFLRGATLLYIEVAKHPYFQEGPDQPTTDGHADGASLAAAARDEEPASEADRPPSSAATAPASDTDEERARDGDRMLERAVRIGRLSVEGRKRVIE